VLSATVLIPAHDEEDSIAELVRACLRSSYPIDEVIVVADSCSDATAERAREAGARVVEVDCKDKASAQNTVLWEIESDAIIGFDGDTRPEPGCIELMMRDLNERGFDATCSTILPLQRRGFFIRARRFSYALGRRWWRLCQAQVGRIQVLTGASYAFKTSVIKAVGGFPSGLISADMDATWAMHAGGYKLGYAGNATALTVDPESFRVWRAQMRRWASGYAQNMAKYRRHLLHPRSLLVVGTALFDLVSLFWSWAFFGYVVGTGHGRALLMVYGFYFALHVVLNIALVATVVGLREAVVAFVPWFLVNFYTRWLYIAALFREWVLGRHYASWTGRQGRATVITPMTRRRKLGLSCVAAAALGAAAVYGMNAKSSGTIDVGVSKIGPAAVSGSMIVAPSLVKNVAICC
jgi:biofilm PGA synthesis N-glycosyltransferase PgaC